MNVGARNVTQSNAVADQNRAGHSRAARESPLIRINVSGTEFYVHKFDLDLHPASLLGSSKLEQFYQPALSAYFFDRNRVVFEHIVTFYQTGKLSFPRELNKELIKRELDFFELELAEEENNQEVVKEIVPIKNEIRARIHMFLLDPTSSKPAGVWAGIDIVFILISIMCYVLETEPGYRDAFKNPAHPLFAYLTWTERIVTGFFTVDFIIRTLTWPGICPFVKSPQNVVDFVSLVPFYAELFLSQYMFIESGKILRIFRIFRVIKLFKYFADMFLIIEFVMHAWRELVLVSMLTGILLILFGSVIYFAEIDSEDDHFYSIMQGLWWSMVTITTVGYGDVYPTTITGRFFGSVLVIMSMVVLTLPMTVVISKFNRAYESDKRGTQKLVIVDSELHSNVNSNIHTFSLTPSKQEPCSDPLSLATMARIGMRLSTKKPKHSVKCGE